MAASPRTSAHLQCSSAGQLAEPGELFKALSMAALGLSLALALSLTPSLAAASAPTGEAVSFLYGGILSEFLETAANDTDVRTAVATAIEHLASFKGTCFDVAAIRPRPRVMLMSRNVLHHSRDDTTATVHQFMHYGRLYKRQVILGMNYYFTLEWDLPWLDITHPLAATLSGPTPRWTAAHVFVVTRDRTDAFHVLSHVVHTRPFREPGPPPAPHAHHRYRWKKHPLQYSGATQQWVLQGNGTVVPEAVLDAIPALRFDTGPDGRVLHVPPFHAGTDKPADRVCMLPRAGLPVPAFLQSPPGLSALRETEAISPLRVMSYNVWNINGFDQSTYWERLDRLAAQITAQDPDIVAMQEVRHDAMRDSQPSSLFQRLQMYHYVFQPGMSYPEQLFGRVEEGTAIFSKFPIVQHDHIFLPRNLSDQEDAHQRVLLHAAIQTPSEIVHVFVTHLALTEYARDLAVLAIWRHMQKFSGLCIFMGDLNADPPTPAMRFLDGKQEIEGVRVKGMFDAWLSKYPEPRPGNKYEGNETRDAGLTFNVLHDHLVKRIDYAFVRPDNSSYTLGDIWTVPDNKTESGFGPASDHLAVMLTFAP